MQKISVGGDHSCAVKEDGGVLCWGRGSNGLLGNDDTVSKDHPVAVVDGDASSTTPLSGIVQVSAGQSHSCALKEDGGVLCWGFGGDGRLGNGAADDKDHPVAVVDGDSSTTPLSGIVQISAGRRHNCALKEDGGVLCWGKGDNGRLGNGAADNKDHSVAVVDGDSSTTPLSGIVQISAGGSHSCALKEDGGVLCWGAGGDGRLGNGGINNRNYPVAVVDGDSSTTPLSGIVQISTGGSHSCALKEDGGVLCWGLGVKWPLGQ